VVVLGRCVEYRAHMGNSLRRSVDSYAQDTDFSAESQMDTTSTGPTDGSDPATPKKTAPASVGVVIPTFRRQERLERLIDTLLAGTVVPDEIVVVDNDPAGSVVAEGIPSGVQVVTGGFGINVTAARNLGWRSTTTEIVIFVDDDNEVDSRFTQELRDACADARIGLAGPIIYAGDEGTIWCGGVRQSRWTGISRCLWKGMSEPLDQRSAWPTSAVPDAFALPRAVLDRVGGLDEITFPMCGEEYDLAERVAALGLERVVVRAARVNHYGNVSENPGQWLVSSTVQHGAERARFMARARVRVHRLHSHGLPRYTTLLVFVPLWALVSMATCLLAKAPLSARIETIRAIAAGLTEGYREVQPSSSPI